MHSSIVTTLPGNTFFLKLLLKIEVNSSSSWVVGFIESSMFLILLIPIQNSYSWSRSFRWDLRSFVSFPLVFSKSITIEYTFMISEMELGLNFDFSLWHAFSWRNRRLLFTIESRRFQTSEEKQEKNNKVGSQSFLADVLREIPRDQKLSHSFHFLSSNLPPKKMLHGSVTPVTCPSKQ
jgi:hypothetical protein